METFSKQGVLKGRYFYNAIGQRVRGDKNADVYYHYDTSGKYLGETLVRANESGYVHQVEYIYLDDTPVTQIKTNNSRFQFQ